METRVCTKCSQEKILKDFQTYKNRSGELRYNTYCLVCYKLERKQYRKENKEKLKAGQKEWRENNKEKKKAANKAWYEANKEYALKRNNERRKKRRQDPEYREKERIRSTKWNLENPEYKKKWQKDYYEANKEKLYQKVYKWRENVKGKSKEKLLKTKAAWNRKKRKEDPLFALKERIRGRIGQAIRQGGWKKKKSKTQEILGCTFEELMKHIEQQFPKNMNWDNRDEWDIDHIIPFVAADNENELYALSHYKNIQPLWSKENESKNDSYDPKDKEDYLKWYYSEFPDKKPTS